MGVESNPSRGRGWAGSLLHVRSIGDRASRAAHGRPRAGKAAPAQHGDKTPKTNVRSLGSGRGNLRGRRMTCHCQRLWVCKPQVMQRVDEIKPALTCQPRCPTESQCGERIPSALFSSLQNAEHGERLAGHRINAVESLACGLILTELTKTAGAPEERTCPWHRLRRDPEQL